MVFEGHVDFSPNYKVVPGDPPLYFPPKAADPGAVADSKWSSIVVLPGDLVLNAQIVHNDSGSHDRLVSLDLKGRSATMSILDGVQLGKQISTIWSLTHQRRSPRFSKRASMPRRWRKSPPLVNPCRTKNRRCWASLRC